MYRKLDEKGIKQNSSSLKIIEALEKKDFKNLYKNLMNDFEIVLEENEEFLKAKKAFESEGTKPLLAGSGSCLFGIFENKEKAKKVYNNLKEKYETYICASYNLRRNNFEK